MNVCLIDPPTSIEQIYGDWDLSELDTSCPPLGLLYIASFLREYGHQMRVIDVAARGLTVDETLNEIMVDNPDIVGFSAKTINIHSAAFLAKELKVKAPEIITIVGGAHITAVPEKTLQAFPQFDYGIFGEGEITTRELVECLSAGQSVSAIDGVIWRGRSGKININNPRELISNLDVLPLPAWDLLSGFPHIYKHSAIETKRLPAASIITSRGCPFHCTFCDRAIFGTRIRQHSADYTLNMIKYLVDNYGIRDLMFLDDNFIIDKKKLFAVCDGIIAKQIDLTWYCMGHAKHMTNDRLEKIRKAGCWFIEIGIESGSDKILQSIKKGTKKIEIAAAVQRARKAGLKVKGNFIFGFPEDSIETLEETIEFARELNLSYFQQNYLTVWPGCEIAKELEKQGRSPDPWDSLAHQRITYIPELLTEKKMVDASKKAFMAFYLRPRIILQFLISAASFRGVKTVFVSFIVFLRTVWRK